MDKYKSIYTEEVKEKVLEISYKSYESDLEELIKYIKKIGGPGHSFSIVVDPDTSEYKKTFYWDGDGSDYITSIKLDGKELKV